MAGSGEFVIVLDRDVQKVHVVLTIDACNIVMDQASPRHRWSGRDVQRVWQRARADGKQVHGLEDDGALTVDREGLGLERLLGAARIGKEHKGARKPMARNAEKQRAYLVQLLATEIGIVVAAVGRPLERAPRCVSANDRHVW
jgi:hypothetical protein